VGGWAGAVCVCWSGPGDGPGAPVPLCVAQAGTHSQRLAHHKAAPPCVRMHPQGFSEVVTGMEKVSEAKSAVDEVKVGVGLRVCLLWDWAACALHDPPARRARHRGGCGRMGRRAPWQSLRPPRRLGLQHATGARRGHRANRAARTMP